MQLHNPKLAGSGGGVLLSAAVPLLPSPQVRERGVAQLVQRPTRHVAEQRPGLLMRQASPAGRPGSGAGGQAVPEAHTTSWRWPPLPLHSPPDPEVEVLDVEGQVGAGIPDHGFEGVGVVASPVGRQRFGG